IHAGWRGTAAKIVQKAVKKMQEEFKSESEDIIALIGPAIGKCCFEVDKDTMEKILSSVKDEEKVLVCDKMNVDLKLVNKFQLLAMGVEKIDLCEDCTCCKNELFFSYRKEKGNCARHSLAVMLKRGEK
ncbi:MAG TPA: polyphenol oxidase family protein, partial [Candidatus Gastranaerophilaceae bacterium]|nr:polyphenol oxidase family protein [Candidatus Gastranaerophilaceae bacterium]